jgi:hypothetical protein
MRKVRFTLSMNLVGCKRGNRGLPGMIAAATLYIGIEINYAATKIIHFR